MGRFDDPKDKCCTCDRLNKGECPYGGWKYGGCEKYEERDKATEDDGR